MAGQLESHRTRQAEKRTDQHLARVDQETRNAVRRVDEQFAKERAAVVAICSCAQAVSAVPESAPPALKAMTERIARGTGRLIGRML
ncbi:hypothetical protein [Gordonia sp. (in: high G+C Gram-positive bacteria)]|jgi:hypothetical protein|uniref:hypothetical protein n=1 Tax=Gordonia sp. (in: high G+C Gram-positive bacteria) TaxID=84139 RepID=UPI001D68F6ED|nr:hypothetical protein [Gordonia sp. (in: high G+C Gram-positive bacteria)]MCB1294174.1 hypothetical protein [Gordonia sp. (in: high G+C Gram-positive bacteria)]HMS75855.1 hypothetical protein [Gordonia sp. (in: high G+C Gram-positive bacteria)]HQV19671.1 hypothetical protein [Gordonia sp. (in: high G+C Gram-positive bacteria)]